ncbi:30S ribosomal protein S5 [candidate division WOR-3 bacterium]|nr:30S ribosomal protein S5 [candidate division WOR-3 bacterium]
MEPTHTLETEFEERTINIKRVAKTVKGGKRMRLSVCCAVGDSISKVGIGFGKAKEIVEALRKAKERAQKTMVEIKHRGRTIPHRVLGKCGGAKILIRPASPGTGIIACNTVRVILELGGIKDALTKCFGSTNPMNLSKATINALLQLRTREEIAKLRGLKWEVGSKK